MLNLLKSLKNSRKGAALVEYGLVIAGVAMVGAAAVSVFGTKAGGMVATTAAVIPSANIEDNGTIVVGRSIETTNAGQLAFAAMNQDGFRLASSIGDSGLGDLITDPDGFNANGWDEQGFGRDGFNVDGWNREGYGRDGYNEAGYNKDGIHRDGYTEIASDYHTYSYDYTDYKWGYKYTRETGKTRDGESIGRSTYDFSNNDYYKEIYGDIYWSESIYDENNSRWKTSRGDTGWSKTTENGHKSEAQYADGTWGKVEYVDDEYYLEENQDGWYRYDYFDGGYRYTNSDGEDREHHYSS